MDISTHFQVRQNVLRTVGRSKSRELGGQSFFNSRSSRENQPMPPESEIDTVQHREIPNVCRVEALHVNSLPLKQNPWKIKFPFGIPSRAASFSGSV